MTTLREAAQQALEALEENGRLSAIAILRAALEQPEPFQPDWDRIEPLQEALREHMAEIHRLRAAMEQPEQERAQAMRDAGYTRRPTLREMADSEQPEQCSCGDRPKNQCPGEWEPGCDLGNNPKYARRVPLEQEPVAWLYPEGFEALKNGKCWTAYGTKQGVDCSIPVYLNGAVAPKVEPAQAECAGFDSQPASQRKQPEQEPVAWQWLTTAHFRKKLPADAELRAWNPLFTRPTPPRVARADGGGDLPAVQRAEQRCRDG